MNYLLAMFERFTCLQLPSTIAEETASIQNIPIEILQLIFSKATLRDHVSISRVCKRWHVASEDQFLWKNLFHQLFVSKEKQLDYKKACETKIKAIFLEVDKGNPNFHNEINKESKAGQKILFRMTKRFAMEYPSVLCQNIQNIGIESEDKKISLAAKIFRSRPSSLNENIKVLAENFRNFGIEKEKDRINLARLCGLYENIKVVAENFRNFGIEKEENRFNLAVLCGLYSAGALCNNIQNFDIKNEKEKVKLAKICLKWNPNAYISNFQNFDIQSEDARNKLEKISFKRTRVKKDEVFRDLFIQKFNILDPQTIDFIIQKSNMFDPQAIERLNRNMDSKAV